MRRLALAALCALAAACAVPLDPPPAGPPDDDAPPRAGGVFRLRSDDDVHTLDPAIGYDTASWSFEQMLFDTLVTYDAGVNLVPDLAESWAASPDGRRYSFRLRRDVRFSTGRRFEAADVKYSLERLLQPTMHSQGAEFFQGIEGVDDYVAGRAPGVAGIRTPEPATVEFTLRGVDPLFVHKLAMMFAAVVDREAVEREGEGFARHPVGTGPFVLEEWVYGQRMRLGRNVHYFRSGLPYLDGVLLTIGVNDQLAWFKYQRGELDIGSIPSAEFARVRADARYRPLIVERTTLTTFYLGLNCGVSPFDRLPVRQAMNLAVDKRRILDLINHRGMLASGILPPDMPGHEAIPETPPDAAAARARLAAAGLPDGFSSTLWALRADDPMRMAQSIQQDLRAVGIDLTLKPVDFPALIQAERNPGMVPAFLGGWEADFPDPSNFLTVLLHTASANNTTFFSNPEIDRMLDAAEPILDLPRRFALFHTAELRVLADAPWVPLYHATSVGLRHPRVRNYRLHPMRPSRYESVWLAW